MKYLKPLTLVMLVAATVIQAGIVVNYHFATTKLRQQSAALKTTAEELHHAKEAYGHQPPPCAEICMEELIKAGATNVHCLVWGEYNGKMTGMMVDSNRVTVLPHMSLRMSELEVDDLAPRKKL